ncbi:MAG TPA: tetratricopeptide repeat protein [Acidobacteriaceae bacterium]|nr:tetratricopeptide repeat protein [Acidobacteriaceae bacterium]
MRRHRIVNRIAGAIVLLLCCSGVWSQNTAQEVPSETALATMPPERLGDLLMTQHRYVEAAHVYNRAPVSAVILNKIGVAWHHLSALGEARHHYEQALQLDPNYADAMNNLGAVYFAEQNYRKAIHYYQRALRLAPGSAVYLVNLGTAYFAENKTREGEQAYQKALAIDSEVFDLSRGQIVPAAANPRQRAQLDFCVAKLLAQSGQPDDALEFLNKAVAAGFTDWHRLMEDPALAQLRRTPGFSALVAEMGAR